MAHFNLATLLTGSKQESEALPEYRKACALSPENTLFLESFGASLAVNGDMNEAVAQLQKAVALLPTSAEFRFNLGYVMESHGDYAGAVGPLEKSVELSQAKNPRSLSELARAYSMTGRFAEAKQTASQALDLAVQAHDEKTVKNLRDALDRYERGGAQANPQ
jgi:Flp pilus assembly protein TadD